MQPPRDNQPPPPMLAAEHRAPDPAYQEMEQAYAQMLSAVVQMARVLGKPNPIVTRRERRTEAPPAREAKCEYGS